MLHKLGTKEVGQVDERTRERFTDNVYNTLIMLFSKQEEAVTEYELRAKKEPDTKEPA